MFELGEKGIADCGIGDSVMQPGGCINVDAEAFAGGVCAGIVGVGPFGVFADKFDVCVTGLGDVGEALLEGKVVPHRPEHDGEREGRICCGRFLGSARGFGVHESASDCSGCDALRELTAVDALHGSLRG